MNSGKKGVLTAFSLLGICFVVFYFFSLDDSENIPRNTSLVPHQGEKMSFRKTYPLSKELEHRRLAGILSYSEKKRLERNDKEFQRNWLTHRDETISERYWELAPAVLQEMIDSEVEDTSWRDTILKEGPKYVIDNNFLGTRVLEAECGMTVCKVVFEHDDMESWDPFYDYGVDEGPWKGEQIGGWYLSDEGRPVSYVYFTHFGDYRPIELMKDLMYDKVAYQRE